MLNLSISITEKIGRIEAFKSLKRMPILRRNGRIRSIHSSLVIEANSLSLEEVRDVIAGKAVIGPKKEIDEVKNAYKAYEMMKDFDAYNVDDLLKAYEVMMSSVLENPGKYRKDAEGVMSGVKVIFIAPSHEFVPKLMNDLFNWLKNDDEVSILIKSCVFHYEFVFIHPFSDGNGRIARLWQNVILTRWNPIFEYIPIESRIERYQSEYYDSIALCNKNGNSDAFICFMLKTIDETLDEIMISIKRIVEYF